MPRIDKASERSGSTGDPAQTRAILARFAPAGVGVSAATRGVVRRRVVAIALTLAAVTTATTLLKIPLASPQFEDELASLLLLMAATGVALDLGMALIASRPRFHEDDVFNAAYVYWVLRCASLSLAPLPSHGLPTLTWVAVLVVLFPVVFSAETVQARVAVAASAATQPLALLAASAGHGGIDLPTIARSTLSATAATFLGLIAADLVQRYATEAPRDLGSYDLVQRLGKGGMGEVWSATHRYLARPAAIKLIPRSPNDDARAAGKKLRRFRREAQVTANLTSPHTVAVYDFGITEAGVYYYVMEHLIGLDLQELVAESGPLPPGRAVYLVQQACDSLAEAHEAGLIHRDLKPSNLFVVRQGIEPDFVKVLDFGLVGLSETLRDQSIDLQITAANMMTGTPAYMSPEMVLGGMPLDARADIYGVGCVLFYLVTGELVFPGLRGMPMAVAHAHEPPRSPRDVNPAVPEDLSALILECLAKDRDARPASARALRERLAALRCSGEWDRQAATRWWDHRFPAVATAQMRVAVRRSEATDGEESPL